MTMGRTTILLFLAVIGLLTVLTFLVTTLIKDHTSPVGIRSLLSAADIFPAKTTFDRCDQLRDVRDKQLFLPVDNANNSFVSSALWDNVDKEEQKIRIVGLIRYEKEAPAMYCYIRDKPSSRCSKVKARVEKFPGYKSRKWLMSCVFFCPLPPGTIPEGVSLTTSESGPMYNELTILSDGMDQQPEYQFTMCLSPIQFCYNNTLQLIHYIEVNRMLGADFFVFYNNSMSKSIEAILLSLVEEGLAQIIQWQMPVTRVHYAAQDAALNDCMNRMIYRTKYIVSTDLDEFIIPRQHMNWHNLLNNTQRACPSCSSFEAQTAFFISEHANDSFNFPGRDTAETYQITPLLNLERMTNVPRKLESTKYIYDPRKVEKVWIHWVDFPRNNTKTMQFSDDLARYHHYRERFKHPLSEPFGLVRDTTIFRFKEEILKRVQVRALSLIKVLH